MTSILSKSQLLEFGAFVESRIGLHLPAGRVADLERGLLAAAREMGWTDPVAFTRHLMASPATEELEHLLAAHLTVGETYFYRDPRAFEVFETEVLPQLVRERADGSRRLRIWSAACCTGEEPYSIAMAVRNVLGEESGWQVKILATDLNPRFMQKAAQGVYGRWSFRTLPEAMRGRYFHKHAPERWRIDDRIKHDVTFGGLNLLDDTFPSAASDTQGLDVIFCRNVLMYFSRETASKVIAKLRQCLVPGGWLFTGATDAPRDCFAGFAANESEGTIIYRRSEEVASVSKREDAVGVAERWELTLVRSAVAPANEQKVEPAQEAPSPRDIAPLVAELPVSSTEMRNLARKLADSGKFDEALNAIDQAIERGKLDAVAHYLRGAILHEQGREGEAAVALHRALYLEPGFVLAHVTLGNLMRRGGKEKAARRCFDNARELLSREDRDAVLPESDGITAGRLLHMIATPEEATL